VFLHTKRWCWHAGTGRRPRRCQERREHHSRRSDPADLDLLVLRYHRWDVAPQTGVSAYGCICRHPLAEDGTLSLCCKRIYYHQEYVPCGGIRNGQGKPILLLNDWYASNGDLGSLPSPTRMATLHLRLSHDDRYPRRLPHLVRSQHQTRIQK
jgi:hypothetical protein